jgi:chorismate mutase / prephenate dehydratase
LTENQHPDPAHVLDPVWLKELAVIDAKILENVKQRCLILQKANHATTGTDRPSLRALQSISPQFSDEPGFATRLIRFVSGLTYQESITRETIAYLGPPYSYSYSAAANYFGAIDDLIPVHSITAVFEEINRGQSKYGVVPIENSTDGRIVDTLNMFIKSPVRICGEILLPIHHNLLANCKREEIREVHSKPQALSQCRQWLSSHLPHARWVEQASTAVAAKIASTTPFTAAVASREAAIFEGLDIVAESIEDNPNNITRFAILGNEDVPPTGSDKTSLLFQVPHQPGALADVMVLFRDNGLNLTWIESFPVPGKANEYFFFVELEGHRLKPELQRALTLLSAKSLRMNFLGSYPKGK